MAPRQDATGPGSLWLGTLCTSRGDQRFVFRREVTFVDMPVTDGTCGRRPSRNSVDLMLEPTARQWISYNLGGTLPADLNPWVHHDLLGRGSAVRHVLRFTIPLVPLLLLFLLFPGPVWLPLLMMSLILLPVLYFALGLMNVYRGFRLRQHGMADDPAERKREGTEEKRREYEARFGRE